MTRHWQQATGLHHLFLNKELDITIHPGTQGKEPGYEVDYYAVFIRHYGSCVMMSSYLLTSARLVMSTKSMYRNWKSPRFEDIWEGDKTKRSTRVTREEGMDWTNEWMNEWVSELIVGGCVGRWIDGCMYVCMYEWMLTYTWCTNSIAGGVVHGMSPNQFIYKKKTMIYTYNYDDTRTIIKI